MAANTLLLDSGYQPLDVIDWKKAITLMFLGKAEIVEVYEEEIKSSYLVLKKPAVVRLLNNFRRGKRKVKFSRLNVFIRDNFTCQYCGKRDTAGNLTMDHVLPRCRGGKTNWLNIATSCEECNIKKMNRTPEEAGVRLLNEPKQPNWLPLVALKICRHPVPENWQFYI